MRYALIALIGTCCTLTAATPAIGSPAPDLGSTSSFNTEHKGPVQLRDLRGSVVLIDFWATWCGPCVAAIPHLQDLHNKYAKQGLVVVGHTDGSSRDLESFIASKKITYPISVGKDIGDSWGVTGIPHVFLIDADGKVAWNGHPGSLKDSDITPLLANARPPGPPTPRFEKPSTDSKVSKIEAQISAGKVGTGLKALEKLNEDKSPETQAAAQGSQAVVQAWLDGQTRKIAELEETGDLYAAGEAADLLSRLLTGHDAGKAWKDKAADLKKQDGYKAGQAFAQIEALPAEAHLDTRFPKMVEAFLKKYPDGYYADKARALLDR